MKNKNKGTKFPVARIKKIMQKDEEVGKVAQATPVAISKALELFLQAIVEHSAKVTKSRSAKKVEPHHLKHAINTVEMLDFLKEIVENVPDPTNGGKIPEGGANGEKKKRRSRSTKSKPKKGAKAEEEEEEMQHDQEPEDDDDDE